MFFFLKHISDEVINQNRSMSDVFPCSFFLFVFPDQLVVFVHPDTVCICKNIQILPVARRMLADIHGGTDLQYRARLLLACIDGCCHLRIAKHVQHPVVTDPIPAAKILMRIIICHAPPEASCDILLPCHGIQHICMTQRMFRSSSFTVKCFRRIHMPVILADQIRLVHIGSDLRFFLTARQPSVMDKIIVCIHIFQQMAFFARPDTACRARVIQLMGGSIGALIKRILIYRLIDPHTPQNNGCMIPILQYHIPDVLHRLFFPCFISDMLPAGKLREYEQSQLITPIQKIMGLRIMRGPHGIDTEFLFQNIRICFLHGCGHRIPDIRITLVTVQTSDP